MRITGSHIPRIFDGNIGKNNSAEVKTNISAASPYQSTFGKRTVFPDGLLPAFFAKITMPEQQNKKDGTAVSDYAKCISASLKETCGIDIPPENFKCLMPPDELAKILPELSEDNFICTNNKDGKYCIDLDYQSTFSNGTENVYQIMDDVAIYANDYYAKNGKNFVFALTDRDSVDGLQEALKIIGENPSRFEHVRFIPGIKMSFAHEAPESQLKYENSDMLVYGINPFSKNVISFVDSAIYRRQDMAVNFIRQVYTLYPEFAYTIREFAEQNGLKYKRDYTVSNLYWRAREYAQEKGGSKISGELPPKQIMLEAENILDNLSTVFTGRDKSAFSAIDTELNVQKKVNKDIEKIFKHYSTHKEDDKGKLVSAAENIYDDMIDLFLNEPQKPVMAFSAPYYYTHYFTKNKTILTSDTLDKVVKFFRALQIKSDGMIQAFESIAPIYDLDTVLGNDTISKFNNYMRKNTDLYEVGGSFAKR